MFLTYATYIGLMSALDEHLKSTLSKKKLQEIIFNHYTDRDGYLAAENLKGDKKVFYTKFQKNSYNKKARKIFSHFMNQ